MATVTGATGGGGGGGFDTTDVNTTGVRGGGMRTDDEVCFASHLRVLSPCFLKFLLSSAWS